MAAVHLAPTLSLIGVAFRGRVYEHADGEAVVGAAHGVSGRDVIEGLDPVPS